MRGKAPISKEDKVVSLYECLYLQQKIKLHIDDAEDEQVHPPREVDGYCLPSGSRMGPAHGAGCSSIGRVQGILTPVAMRLLRS